MKTKEKEKYFNQWESEFYDKYKSEEILFDEEFQSIALGFFVAKGLNLEESLEMYEYCIEKEKF